MKLYLIVFLSKYKYSNSNTWLNRIEYSIDRYMKYMYNLKNYLGKVGYQIEKNTTYIKL